MRHYGDFMPAATRTTRERWIEEGLTALAVGGPEAVRVEALAETLGVTKGGFYGQFADRAAFLDAMLDSWEAEATDDVLARVEQEGGDASTRLRRAGELTFSGARLLGVDLAVRDWARRDPDVAGRLRRVDNRRMEYLRELFRAILGVEAAPEDVEARSVLAFCLAIGHHFLAADGDRDTALRDATRLLEH